MSVNVNSTKELKKILENAGIDPDYYSIYPEDNFRCGTVSYIHKKGNCWQIGTFDRGLYCDVRGFDTEAEACKSFIEDFFPEVLNGKE